MWVVQFLFVVCALIECDGFHINSKMYAERLIQVESEMVAFCKYILHEEHKMHKGVDVHHFGNVTTFLEKTRNINEEMSRDPDVITEHPVALYKLRKRISDNWPPVLDHISATELITNIPVIGQTLTKFKKILSHEADADNALNDLLKLQRFYNLRTNHLIKGHVGDWSPRSAKMQDQELFDIGRRLLEMDRPAEALQWLSAGVNMCDHSQHTDQRKHYANVIASTYMQMRRYKEAQAMYEKLLEADPSNRATLSSLLMLDRKLNEQGNDGKDEDDGTKVKTEPRNHWSTPCSSDPIEQKKKSKPDSPLFCYSTYINSSGEYIHTEELLAKPRIVMIYDLFSSNYINLIARQARKQIWNQISQHEDSYFTMDTSTVLAESNEWTDVLTSRLHNVTFQDVNVTDNIISWIQVENAGPGIGGKAVVALKANKVQDRGKIGHYLIFLNNVRHGGTLIFPEIDFSVKPLKGAALFWQFNGFDDPHRYSMQYYLQCPVLLGTQWIAKAVADFTYDLREINL